MNQIIDGKKFSQALRDKVKNCVKLIKEKKGVEQIVTRKKTSFI